MYTFTAQELEQFLDELKYHYGCSHVISQDKLIAIDGLGHEHTEYEVDLTEYRRFFTGNDENDN